MGKVEFLKACDTLYKAMLGTGVKVKKKLTKKDQEDPESFMKVLDKGSDDPKCAANQKDRFNELCDLFEGLGKDEDGDPQQRPDAAGTNTNSENSGSAGDAHTEQTQTPQRDNDTQGTATIQKIEPKKTRVAKTKPAINPLEAAIIDLMSKVPEKEIENLKAATMVAVLRVSKK